MSTTNIKRFYKKQLQDVLHKYIMMLMDKININDLRAVATLREIGEAFGCTPQNVQYWVKVRGSIPGEYLYRYEKGLLPDGKKKALALYKRALKRLRQQNG